MSPVAAGRIGADVLRTAHPGPAAVVTLVALGLAVSAGLAAPSVALVVAAVAAGQLSIGWSNDWLDARRGWDRLRADKPAANGRLELGLVRNAAVTAAMGCIVLSAALGPLAALLHLLAVASGWAYNLGVKATPASVVPYAVSFALLPSVLTAAAGAGVAPWWATLTGACFGSGVHFANVLPDLDVDAVTGVRGLPQRVGARRSVLATVALLGVGTAVIVTVPAAGPASTLPAWIATTAVSVLLGMVLYAGLRGDYRRSFVAAMTSGLIVVGLLVLRGAALT